MRIAILELPATWGDPAPVLDEVDARLRTGPAADLVVLPEASLRGYVSPDATFDLAPFAEPIDGPTAAHCATIARAHATHLVAPLVLAEGHAIYNAMACWDPKGEIAFIYRKRHPWFPESWATAGLARAPVITICDRVITIAVCYDVHFIAYDASAELTCADLLVFPSAWVEDPDNRVDRLARIAKRFELVIANANWAPGVVRVPGQGGSCFIGTDGHVIDRAPLAGRIDLTI